MNPIPQNQNLQEKGIHINSVDTVNITNNIHYVNPDVVNFLVKQVRILQKEVYKLQMKELECKMLLRDLKKECSELSSTIKKIEIQEQVEVLMKKTRVED